MLSLLCTVYAMCCTITEFVPVGGSSIGNLVHIVRSGSYVATSL